MAAVSMFRFPLVLSPAAEWGIFFWGMISSLAFSAGGDGGRGLPEHAAQRATHRLRQPADCRTIAIYESAFGQTGHRADIAE
jgi:hypothetical protein